MRVLLLADSSSPNVQSFKEGLRHSDVDITLASLETHGADCTLWAPSVFGLVEYMIAGLGARRLSHRVSPHVVVGYFASGYGTVARLSGVHPLVLVVAGSDVLAMTDRRLARRVTRRNLRSADLVVTWGPHLASVVRQWGVPAERIVVQSRGVDTMQFRPPSRPVASPRVITTRALSGKYRHDIVLRALADTSPDVTLTVAGNGPEAPKLQSLAEALGVAERVTFAGGLTPAQLALMLREHSIYVSACMTDGVSASLLEAMASGLLPIVVGNEANRLWLPDSRYGTLYDGSVASLAESISAAAAADSGRRRRVAQLNRRVILERGDRDTNMRAIASALVDLSNR